MNVLLKRSALKKAAGRLTRAEHCSEEDCLNGVASDFSICCHGRQRNKRFTIETFYICNPRVQSGAPDAID